MKKNKGRPQEPGLSVLWVRADIEDTTAMRRLVRSMQFTRDEALMTVMKLWSHAARWAPDGRLHEGFDADDLADICAYRGDDSAALWKAMSYAGFIGRDGGRVVLPGWADGPGRQYQDRKTRREKTARYRARQAAG